MGIGFAVADDPCPFYTKKRRPAILRIINTLFKILKRGPRKQISQFGHVGLYDLILEHFHRCFSQTFANFQADITDKTIAYDDIYITLKDITSLYITDKVE